MVGLIAASAAVLILLFTFRAANTLAGSESLTSVLLAAVNFGVCSSVLGAALLLAGLTHRRQALAHKSLRQVVFFGLVAGAITGGLMQALHNGIADSTERMGSVVVFSSWILASGSLGAALSRFVPNLDPLRGLIAGLIAGLVAGCCGVAAIAMGLGTYLVVSFLGYLIVGAALGLAISVVERRFREATVEVNWTPRESTRFGLGPEPLTIGGGNSHILIPNAPGQVSSIALKKGRIEHVEAGNGQRTILKDGSRLRVGGLIMVIHSPLHSAPHIAHESRSTND